MAFPTSGLLDNFQRANIDPLDTLWVTATAWWGAGLQLVSNRAATSAGGGNVGGSIWSTQIGPDVEVYVTVTTIPGTTDDYIGFDLFVQKTDVSVVPDGYSLTVTRLSGGDFRFGLGRYDAGVPAGVAIIDVTTDLQNGDGVGLVNVAGAWDLYRQRGGTWSLLGSGTDTTYISAPFWVTLNSDDSHGTAGEVRLDNFGGGAPGSMPNLTSATATVISSLPFSTSQTIQEGYVPNRVWYTFTAPQSGVINIFPFGDLTNYDVELTVRVNNAVDLYLGLQNRRQVPTYFPVTAGVQYWLDFPPPTTNYLAASPLVLQASYFTASAIPSGSIFINDESTAGYPASYMDPVTGEVVSFLLDFPGGEQMVQLTDGTIFLEDIDTATFAVYSADKVFVATAPGIYNNIHISSNRTTRFYSGNSSTFEVQRWTPLAVSERSWTVASAPVSLAPSRDDAVLYYAAGTTGATIRRWDLVADAGMADLAVGVSGYIVKEIFVLQDETILVVYRRTSPYDVYIVRYDVDGTTLNTYATQLDDSVGADTHLAFTNEDPTTFAVWIKIAGGYSRFMVLQTSDGTILSSFDRVHFSSGSSDADPAASPPAFFGPSESCTFLITTTGSSGCPGRRTGQQIGA